MEKSYTQSICSIASAMSGNGVNSLIVRRKVWLLAAVLLTVSIPAFTGLWRLWHCDKNFDGQMLVPVMCGLILMITAGAATALVLNFLRIFVTMQMRLGGLEQYTVGFWHGFLGIAVFIVGCVTLSRFSRFLKPLNRQNQKEAR